MKRKTFHKSLVFGAVVIFLITFVQPVPAIEMQQDEEITSNDISVTRESDEDCNCPNVDKSGNPICDKLLEKINDIELKFEKIAELLNQYEDNPILYGIIESYKLILLYGTSIIMFFWGYYGCDFPD